MVQELGKVDETVVVEIAFLRHVIKRIDGVATIGVYGMRQSAFDLVLLYVIGLLGVVMRRFSFPTAPVVVGMILGPLAEAQMRNALSIGEGHWSVFVQRPMSLFLLLVVLALTVLVLRGARRHVHYEALR